MKFCIPGVQSSHGLRSIRLQQTTTSNHCGRGCRTGHPRKGLRHSEHCQVGCRLDFGLALCILANDATPPPDSNELFTLSALDFILLMNYDFWGAWDGVLGMNSPLYGRPGLSDKEKNWNIVGVHFHKNSLKIPIG